MVGALVVTLVGGFVGTVKRVTVPPETSPMTNANNQLLLDEYTKQFRNTAAPISHETEQRVQGFVEKEFSLHRVGNE